MRLPSFNSARIAILLAVLAPWFATIWVSIHIYTPTTDIHLQQGQFAITTTARFLVLPYRVAPTLEITGPGRPFRWWFQSYRSSTLIWRCIPLWLPPLAALALLHSARYVLQRHRRRRGLCRKCAYDLAGLPPNSPCPECGQTRTP